MESLPGLNDASQASNTIEGDNELHEVSIPQGCEWKIEVPGDVTLTIEIKSGIAEIFGTELANGREYHFKNYNFSLFCVEDTVLDWRCPAFNSGSLSISSNQTAKYVYNLHFALEKMRSSSFDGPRALVIGSQNSGKTALCRTLCSYAIKYKSYQPMYVNLDPQQAIFTVPGCLAAIPISSTLDVRCSTWGQSMTSGATELHSKQPLVKNFGLENVSENKSFYLNMVEQLASNVSNRLLNDSMARRSGCIIDVPSISHLDENLGDLEIFATQFKINAAIILGNYEGEDLKRIADKLSPYVGNNIINLPPLSGCIPSSDVYKRSLQRSAIREYFYGTEGTVLSPYAVGVDYDDVTVWRPKSTLENENSSSDASPNRFLPVEIEASNLQHALVAITYADRKISAAEVAAFSLLGFGLITEVNDKRKKVRILLPVPGNLPKKALVLTSYRYLE